MEFGERIDPVQLRQKVRDAFIMERSKQEQEVAMYYRQLLACSKELVLDKIPFDYTVLESLQTLIPELYKEAPNKEVCLQQYKEANEKLNIVNQIIADLNKDGLDLLIKYRDTHGIQI